MSDRSSTPPGRSGRSGRPRNGSTRPPVPSLAPDRQRANAGAGRSGNATAGGDDSGRSRRSVSGAGPAGQQRRAAPTRSGGQRPRSPRLSSVRRLGGFSIDRRTELVVIAAALLLVSVLVLVVATRWWTAERPHGTPMQVTDALVAPPRGDPDTAFAYAKDHGATRLDDVRAYLDEVYRLAPQVGIDPCIVVAQSALETANWTSEYWTDNLNPAGINITYAGKDSDTWDNGADAARAQLVHLAVYVFGRVSDDSPLAPYRDLDPYYEGTSEAAFAGTVHTIEDLAKIWAADPSYATSLVSRGDDVFGGGVSPVPSDAIPAVGRVRPGVVR